MYMEMRCDADIRNNLCEKYKLDADEMKKNMTRAEKKAEEEIKALEEKAMAKALSPKKSQTSSPSPARI